MFTVQGAKLLGFGQSNILFAAPSPVSWTTSTFLKIFVRVWVKIKQITRYFTRGRVPPPRTMVVKRTTIKVVVTSTFLTLRNISVLFSLNRLWSPPPHQIQGEARVHMQWHPWETNVRLYIPYLKKKYLRPENHIITIILLVIWWPLQNSTKFRSQAVTGAVGSRGLLLIPKGFFSN